MLHHETNPSPLPPPFPLGLVGNAEGTRSSNRRYLPKLELSKFFLPMSEQQMTPTYISHDAQFPFRSPLSVAGLGREKVFGAVARRGSILPPLSLLGTRVTPIDDGRVWGVVKVYFPGTAGRESALAPGPEHVRGGTEVG